jgi:release factor glutamine methyltransferase
MMRATRLRQEIEDAVAALEKAGVGSPRAEAEELAAHAAGTSRGRLAVLDSIDDQFVSRYAELIAVRSRRIPLQHITGTAAFGPVDVQVGPGVFIPRPETESLLDWATRLTLPSSPLVVDLCTGSGALAVSLARTWPSARVIAIDNSPSALDYARRNTAGTRVELRLADAADPALMRELDGQVDLIVANPPYLLDGAQLEPEVAEHDPSQALFGGPDGMAVIIPIVGLAARWLRPGATIAVEHDDTTSGATVDLFVAAGVFDEITPRKDLAGRPRFVTARRSNA